MSAGWTLALPDSNADAAMTKTGFAYARVREQILTGDLAPGQSIDQEALAERLGLSTTPVREALRRLASERLVVIRAHRDTVVAPVSLDMLEDVYTVRLELDPLAAALAAANATERHRAVIAELRHATPDGDPANHLRLNRHLHRSIYSACGNSVLVHLLDRLWDASDRYRLILVMDAVVSRSADIEHDEIAQAVLDRRPERASRLMRQHVADSLDGIRTMRENAKD